MAVKKIPGPKGGYRATYGGKTRLFKTKKAAEDWAKTFNVASRKSKPRPKRAGPGRRRYTV